MNMKKFIIYLFITFILFVNVSISKESDIFRLQVIFTNDIHGGIDPSSAVFINPEFPPALGGGASMAGYITQVRESAKKKGEGFLLLDAGDFFQGTPLGNESHGKAIIKYMNAIGYDALTLGNHDFDQGIDVADTLCKMANFPILGANIVCADTVDTCKVVGYLKPYIIKEFNGIKIGIIGLTTEETEGLATEEQIAGLDFLPVQDVAQKYIKELKEKGVDIIMGLVHLGIPYDYEKSYKRILEHDANNTKPKYAWNAMHLAHWVKGFDVMFCGHIHVAFATGWEEPSTHTILFQTTGRGSSIGHTTLLIDKKTKTLMGYEIPTEPQAGYGGTIITTYEDELWPLPEYTELIGVERAPIEKKMNEVIGQTLVDVPRGGEGESQMGNLVMDAIRESASKSIGDTVDLAILNYGGIRDNLYYGDITVLDAYKVLPLADEIVVIQMTGEQLKEMIESRIAGGRRGVLVSGIKLVYNKKRKDMDRITCLTIGGKPLDFKKNYKVATSKYLASGAIGFDQIFSKIPKENFTYTKTSELEALIDYIRNHSPINPVIDGRWIRDDTAEPCKY